jgi:hypothetical protein
MKLSNEGSATTTHRLLLTAAEASEQLAISPRTLWAITFPRGPLPVVRVGPSGRAVRYDPRDLREWLDAQKIGGPRP